MNNIFERTELLLGTSAIDKLKKSNIIIFGVGGVGGYVTEALVRSGVSNISIVDNDTVSPSNINRQIIATTCTIGKYKVDVMEERIKQINPNANVIKYNCFFSKENMDEFDFKKYDYIIDCIDSVESKLELIAKAYNENIKIISSMGAGNKLNPQGLMISDINKTEMDPLARKIRYELRKRGIKKLKVAYSKEEPKKIEGINFPASNAWVPASMGLLIASEVIKDLI